MTDPKRAARQLQDLTNWAPLLTDTITTLTSPRSPGAHASAHSTHHDLGDLLAPTIDAPDQGATAIRTHAQITEWATAWAQCAELHYTSNPLHALANNTQRLASEWDDWDAFTDDLTILHTRIAHITGHAPIRLHPCPQPGCDGTITAPTTRNGTGDFAWCDHCDTLYHTDPDEYAEELLTIAQHTDTAARPITAAQAAHIWNGLITVDQIKKWKNQGRLTPRDTNPNRYDLTDIRALIHERDTKYRNTPERLEQHPQP